MSKLVSQKEMAKILGICERTLSRMVKNCQLPCHLIGKRKKFNPQRILALTETVEVPKPLQVKKVRKETIKRNPDTKRFAEMLGLV